MRRRLPVERESVTRKFELVWPHGEHVSFYITVGLYENGDPGEIAVATAKMGEFPHGVFRALAMAASLALQYGAPMSAIVAQWRGTRFPPEGFTPDPRYRRCSSLLDLVARWLDDEFCRAQEINNAESTAQGEGET